VNRKPQTGKPKNSRHTERKRESNYLSLFLKADEFSRLPGGRSLTLPPPCSKPES
jgi:hypothetical protein